MKLGLIVEGLPDMKVLTYLAKRIVPGLAVVSRTLGNKSDLIDNCGKTANRLLDLKCDRVIIVWDLYPDSRRRLNGRTRRRQQQKSEPNSCDADSKRIDDKLRIASSDVRRIDRIDLVCIDAMLETWLLMDHRALRGFFLSRGGLREPVKPVSKLRQNQHPKDVMKKLFREKSRSGLRYNDVDDAIKIAREIPVEEDDLKRLKKLDSFSLFASVLLQTFTQAKSPARESIP